MNPIERVAELERRIAERAADQRPTEPPEPPDGPKAGPEAENASAGPPPVVDDPVRRMRHPGARCARGGGRPVIDMLGGLFGNCVSPRGSPW